MKWFDKLVHWICYLIYEEYITQTPDTEISACVVETECLLDADIITHTPQCR